MTHQNRRIDNSPNVNGGQQVEYEFADFVHECTVKALDECVGERTTRKIVEYIKHAEPIPTGQPFNYRSFDTALKSLFGEGTKILRGLILDKIISNIDGGQTLRTHLNLEDFVGSLEKLEAAQKNDRNVSRPCWGI